MTASKKYQFSKRNESIIAKSSKYSVLFFTLLLLNFNVFSGPLKTAKAFISNHPTIITSPTTASGVVGIAFSYTITISSGGHPTYGASGLPTGLVLDASTGIISGIPTVSGTFSVNLSASSGGGSLNLTLSIAAAPPSNSWNLIGNNEITSSNFIGTVTGNTNPLLVKINGAQTASFGASFNVSSGFNTLASGWGSNATGSNTIASGGQSTAMGSQTTASNFAAVAMGNLTTASGWGAFAMGSGSSATGDMSFASGNGAIARGWGSVAIGAGSATSVGASMAFAMGNGATANGWTSSSIGWATSANGDVSTAIGGGTVAASRYEVALGAYNTTYTPVGGTSGFNAADRIFSIGNGTTSSSRSTAFTILKNGFVGIGTTVPADALDVNGNIKAKKLIITQIGWVPDYVFADNYSLPTIQSLEEFIKKNKHLPGVASAKEINEKGLDVGANYTAILKQEEELTLYVIDQNKKIEALQTTNCELQEQNTQLQKLEQKFDQEMQEIENLKEILEENKNKK